MFGSISVTRRYVRFLFESQVYPNGINQEKVPNQEDETMYAPTELVLDTELQLPTTDDSRVGEDV